MTAAQLVPGVIVGVDTHKDTHTAAAVTSTGAVLEHLTVAADPGGYRRLLTFGRRHEVSGWAIEGTGSFGAGLTTALLAQGERVFEVDRPQRPARRAGVKSDGIDAVRAARQALAGVGLADPRSRGEREAIRVLLTTRAQAVDFRTRAIAALHALVTSAPAKIPDEGLRPAQARRGQDHAGGQTVPQALRRTSAVPTPRNAPEGGLIAHRSVPVSTVENEPPPRGWRSDDRGELGGDTSAAPC